MGLLKSISARKNKKMIKKLRARALQIDALKDQMAALTDEQLKAKTKEFQEILAKEETLNKDSTSVIPFSIANSDTLPLKYLKSTI